MTDQIARAGTRVAGFEDPELEFQLVRQLGATATAGASVGETFSAAARIRAEGQARWTAIFSEYARRQLDDADARAAAGHRISARDQYLVAGNSFRAAEYFSPAGASETAELGQASQAAFGKAMAAAGVAVEQVSIAVDGLTLPGLFFRAPGAVASDRLLMVVSGFDGTEEESYLQVGSAGLERGWNLLMIAGPGQADTARAFPDATFVPDTERWISPWLDRARELPDVDPNRIALLGISYGGYFALRAASADPRFAAVVANSPVVDLHAYNLAFVGYDPEEVMTDADDFGIADLPGIPDEELSPAMKDTTRALIHRFGQPTFLGTFRFLRRFTVDPAAVSCPALALVGAGEGLEPRRQYEEFLAHAGGPVHGHVFTAEEGASSHCQVDNLRFSAAVLYDWLDETLPG